MLEQEYNTCEKPLKAFNEEKTKFLYVRSQISKNKTICDI